MKKILIIGGGVAGMETARAASERGHYVMLFEKNERLGGHLVEACVPEFKKDLKRLLNWYERQIMKLNIEIHMSSEVTPELISDLQFDVAILATGSVPCLPSIPGIQKHLVTNCCEVLLGNKEIGDNVIILGGGLEGCETALWLAQMGKSVRVIETLDSIAIGIHSANRQMLLDMIEDLNIDIFAESGISEIFDDGVTLIDKSLNRRFMRCDNLIIGVGLKPQRNLHGYLEKSSKVFYEIGDCKTPRNIHYAILEGFNVGYHI